MLKLKDLIKSREIIDMVHEYSGKEWSLSYFNIKKNFKGFPDPVYNSGTIYLWNREDIEKYMESCIKKK